MTRSVMTFALLLLPTIAHAASPQDIRFERNGTQFAASVTHDHADQVIDGRELPDGPSFHLRVHGRSVTGNYGDRTIDYSLVKPVMIMPAETAAR